MFFNYVADPLARFEIVAFHDALVDLWPVSVVIESTFFGLPFVNLPMDCGHISLCPVPIGEMS